MAGVRLRDLAAELDLDISTVSRALRGDPRVRPETRELIAGRAASLGYLPNLRARALAEGRSRTVWLVLPGLEEPVEREPAAYAGKWFFERGYESVCDLVRQIFRLHGHESETLFTGVAEHGFEVTEET